MENIKLLVTALRISHLSYAGNEKFVWHIKSILITAEMHAIKLCQLAHQNS